MRSVEISEVFLAAAVAGVVALVLSALIRLARGQRRVLGPALLDGAIVASLAGVVVATLSPLGLLGSRLDHPSEVNLRPLEAMRGAPRYFAVINAVLLVPTIVLLAQRWRRAGIVRLSLAGVALSLFIEGAQLIHPERGTNVDDVLLNSAGAAVAAVIGVRIRRTGWRGEQQRPGGGAPGRADSARRDRPTVDTADRPHR